MEVARQLTIYSDMKVQRHPFVQGPLENKKEFNLIEQAQYFSGSHVVYNQHHTFSFQLDIFTKHDRVNVVSFGATCEYLLGRINNSKSAFYYAII